MVLLTHLRRGLLTPPVMSTLFVALILPPNMGNLEYAMHALHNLSDDDFKRAIILYQQLELPMARS